MLPARSIAMLNGPLTHAFTAGPPSPRLYGLEPPPATVVTTPVAPSTRRTRELFESAMYKLLFGSTANPPPPSEKLNEALTAGPPSPEKPLAPEPAITVVVPVPALTFNTWRWSESETYKFPNESSARQIG